MDILKSTNEEEYKRAKAIVERKAISPVPSQLIHRRTKKSAVNFFSIGSKTSNAKVEKKNSSHVFSHEKTA